jgi:hypothetical protein
MKSLDHSTWHINLDLAAVPLNTMTMSPGSTVTVQDGSGTDLLTIAAEKWPICQHRGCNRYMDDIEWNGRWLRFRCIKHTSDSYLFDKDTMRPISEAFMVDGKFAPEDWEPVDGSYPPDVD